MLFDPVITYFLPENIRNDSTHPRYQEFRVIASSALLAMPLMLLFPAFLFFMHKPIIGYFINDGLIIVMLLSMKFLSHYRIPMTVTALATYYIIYDWIRGSGLIYSSNVSILHMYLLAAIWVDKRYGGWTILGNVAVFWYIYYQTIHTSGLTPVHGILGGPVYALGMNLSITVFFGGFMAYQQLDQERDRRKIRALQDQKITVLDQAVKHRTEQLNTMRENIATDFHDETGNMLSAVTRQAALLKTKLDDDHNVQPIVDSILANSKALYAGSKDFLWHLNHNSDDPAELFDYLTGYGQRFYNQFDIAFSSEAEDCALLQLAPTASLNIIYIFKEAMTNALKHACGTEVQLSMRCDGRRVTYALQDNGRWKTPGEESEHYGLFNMERRCRRNGFVLEVSKLAGGTRVSVVVPVTSPDYR